MFTSTPILRLRVPPLAGLIASASLFALSASASALASSAFTAIDVSGAGTGAYQGTAATAMNAAGDVTGIYIDGNGNEHAFVLPAGGTITPFDASGTGGTNVQTIPFGIDAAGDVAGIYLEPYTFSNDGQQELSRHIHGFLRTASTGAISLIDVPGEDTGKMEGTYVLCMNASGQIAGNYSTTSTTASGTNSFNHGFIIAANGTIQTFDAAPIPNTYGSNNPGTTVVSMNASGELAGVFIDGAGAFHGFLRDAGGNVTLFEDPNAGTGMNQGTVATGINAAGDIIGVYLDSNNDYHGYLRNASTGKFTTIDGPLVGAGAHQGTFPAAFDAAGDIFGTFLDDNKMMHGFVLPANGTLATFDFPGASANNALPGKTGVKLNSELSQIGKSLGLSSYAKRSGNPLIKLKSLYAKAGTVRTESTGFLSGTGLNLNGTISFGNLILNSVNASGAAIGLYSDDNFIYQSYLRAANGSITVLDDQNAGSAAKQGTLALAINDSGRIAGTYIDSKSILHGFLYDTSALTATTTVLTPVPAPNPSLFNEPVTLSATVSAGSSSVPNGENVTFLSGATSLGTAQLTSGAASLTTTALLTGTDSITAVYGGDTNFAGSTSAAINQVVNPASTMTTLKSSLNPSASGQSVNITASVSGQYGGTPTGSVTFSNNSLSLGIVPLSGGQAVLTTSALPVGTNLIAAVYGGDGNFTGSALATLSQVVNAGSSASAVITGISPAFADAGGAAFPLTVNGSGFTSNSAVFWGTTALTTTYVSASQLTAQVSIADIATGGITVAISVVTPAPGGSTSNLFEFAVDSASGSTTGPQFSSASQTVTGGSPANYPVTLPSTVQSATVSCLNLPPHASCSYSASTNTLTISTSSSTPKGTFQVTVVFTETVTGAAAGWILLPLLLLPLIFMRKRLAARGAWVTACLAVLLLAGFALCTGCGGSSSSNGTGCGVGCPAQTHQVTSSGAVTLIVQ